MKSALEDRSGAGPVIDRTHCCICPIENVVHRLEQDPDAWIDTISLIAALNASSPGAIPDSIKKHLTSRLNGHARKGRGRQKPGPTRGLRDLLILVFFERFEGWLKARQVNVGLEGWSALREADWWQGPPSERAARMAKKRLKLTLTWERIRNIAYEVRGPKS